MVKLTDICKNYTTGDNVVQALKGINLQFRKAEFVSILGPSGCGKTTLLNLIGGLDRYDSGDIAVNGKSTKDFKASDWDSYRNHSVGFVFQSYNLIGHQTILANVELALTLAGVSRAERRKRAVQALERVGLGKEIKKKPNQLSGGQMQRVAIARALINDPEILLADEPTGALDSETSRQVMELLKEVSKDRLVIMVTHNGELAEEYSTRIIRFLDGVVINDSNPCNVVEYSTEKEQPAKKEKRKKTSMSFKTAFVLSLKNLLTKKGRTALTSFAGSIGIIGIALILSLSSGFQGYIDRVQEETLSTYPLTIQSATMDGNAIFSAMSGANSAPVEDGKIYGDSRFSEMFNAFQKSQHKNDLKALKEHIDTKDSVISQNSTVQYTYNLTLDFYQPNTDKGLYKVETMEIMDTMYLSMTDGKQTFSEALSGSAGMMGDLSANMTAGFTTWCELIGNQDLLDQQYDVLAGDWPKEYNEVVLAVDENNRINDFTMYALGLKSREDLDANLEKIKKGEELSSEQVSYTFEEIMNLSYKLVLNSDTFVKVPMGENAWKWEKGSNDHIKAAIENAIDIKIVGIVRPAKDSVAQSMSGPLGYNHKLVEKVIELTSQSEIIKDQTENPDLNIFQGVPFVKLPEEAVEGINKIQRAWGTLTLEQKTGMMMQMAGEQGAHLAEQLKDKSDEEKEAILDQSLEVMTATYDSNMAKIGSVDLETPASISIYPKDFNAKEAITKEIEDYNKNNPDKEIKYTDILDLMLSSISTIINAISYVLIAFVSISLVVSSIMIGVITYISVLERTKEIGILRAVGASKRDISRVFNAETFIVGLIAGLLGITVTVLLNIPINIIINNIAEIGNIAALPVGGAIILVAISVVLTLIAGLIPSRIAAKKDPVEALRTE